MYAPLVAAAFLFFALVPGLPYGYFQILRLIVCGSACFSAYTAFEKDNKFWLWAFIAIAVLFNPLLPVHLNRVLWQPIDFATGIIFICSFRLFKKQKGGR